MTINYKRIKPTAADGKRFNKRYVVIAENKMFKFYDHCNAWIFINGVLDHGIEYATEVHEKIMCLYDLKQLKKPQRSSPDCHEASLRRMMFDLNSGILMDNAIRGIIVGEYTLEQLLKRKGY